MAMVYIGEKMRISFEDDLMTNCLFKRGHEPWPMHSHMKKCQVQIFQKLGLKKLLVKLALS